MNILIVGSEGFIGSHCAKYFNDQGHQVVGVDVYKKGPLTKHTIASSNSDFSKLFSETIYDACINASGSANVNFSFEHPDIDFELNVLNVQKLLVQVRLNCPDCKFVNMSSAAVYGNQNMLPIIEEVNLVPISPYGFHKLQSELLLKQYHTFFGLNTCSLRVFSVYGPGLKKQLLWDMRQKMKSQPVVNLFGSGKESRDYIYIDDVVRAIDRTIHGALFDGEVINVANGTEATIKEIAALFYKQMNFSKFSFSGEKHIGNPDNWRADISKLKGLGYQQKIPLSEGIKLYTEWLESEGL